MAFFADAHEILLASGAYIEEVQEVFRANQIGFGTPENFPAFTRTLEKDARLREDLSALAQSFMENQRDMPLRTILSIIAVASGGPGMATSEIDMSEPVNQLVDFLISISGRNRTSPQTSDNRGSPLVDGDTLSAGTLVPSSIDAEAASEQAENHDLNSFELTTPASSERKLPSSNAGDPYAESLSRLELNTLQVKHYLDSIDQRISRMEPRLESLPAQVLSPATPQPRHSSDERYSAAIAPETLSHSVPTKSSQELPLEASSSPETLIPVSVSKEIPAKRRSTTPVFVTLAALILLSLFYWIFVRNTTSVSVHPVQPDLAYTVPPSDVAPVPANSASNPSASNQSSSKQFQDTTNPVPPAQSSAPPSIPGSDYHPQSGNSTSTDSGPSSASSSAAATSPSSPAPGATANLSTSSRMPLAHSDKSTYQHDRLINVSSGIMAANVLSAPQPSYPKIASLTHLQGKVVMQAVISKEGTIENLRVIEGHRLLRGAATGAVRTWRYRPFIVNGRPVEVATIVTVDFTLPR